MFIELTLEGKKARKVLINTTQVTDIMDGNDGAVVYFDVEDYYRVQESYEEIKEKLNKAGKLL